ncbi:retrovirus-related Pol polyprotein from transposon 17.6 [Trichonephila clavipes]|nr:retrovirus-related Pol polyprotein from transposon 17.6 [Trichonephila clavipes]
MIEEGKVKIDLSKTRLEEKQKHELRDLFNSFKGLFSDKPGLTPVLCHEIDTGDKPHVVSRPYRYDRVKQAVLDYHVDKMLVRTNIRLAPDNPEAYRFAVNYRKLNAITKYPHYPLPLIDDLIMNIPHTIMMSALDLRSGYFQLAVNPSDIVKTTRSSRRMAPTHFGVCHLAYQGQLPIFRKGNKYHSKTRDRKVCVCLYGCRYNIVSIVHLTY